MTTASRQRRIRHQRLHGEASGERKSGMTAKLELTRRDSCRCCMALQQEEKFGHRMSGRMERSYSTQAAFRASRSLLPSFATASYHACALQLRCRQPLA